MQYHTVSAMSAYLDSDMLPHPKWFQFEQSLHSIPVIDMSPFSDIQVRLPSYLHLAQSILVLLFLMQVRVLRATSWPVLHYSKGGAHCENVFLYIPQTITFKVYLTHCQT